MIARLVAYATVRRTLDDGAYTDRAFAGAKARASAGRSSAAPAPSSRSMISPELKR